MTFLLAILKGLLPSALNWVRDQAMWVWGFIALGSRKKKRIQEAETLSSISEEIREYKRRGEEPPEELIAKFDDLIGRTGPTQ